MSGLRNKDVGQTVAVCGAVEGITLPVHFAIEYLIQHRWCGCCHKFVESGVSDVLPGSAIDLRAMLLIAYMRVALSLPVQSVAEATERIFSFHVSEGEIIDVKGKLADAFTDWWGRFKTLFCLFDRKIRIHGRQYPRPWYCTSVNLQMRRGSASQGLQREQTML